MADGALVHLPKLLADTFGISSSEGRRLLSTGAVRIAGKRYTSAELDVPAAAIDGQQVIAGRRYAAVIHFDQAGGQ